MSYRDSLTDPASCFSGDATWEDRLNTVIRDVARLRAARLSSLDSLRTLSGRQSEVYGDLCVLIDQAGRDVPDAGVVRDVAARNLDLAERAADRHARAVHEAVRAAAHSMTPEAREADYRDSLVRCAVAILEWRGPRRPRAYLS